MGQEFTFGWSAGLTLEALGTSRTHFTPRTRWSHIALWTGLTSTTLGSCGTCRALGSYLTNDSGLTLVTLWACRSHGSGGTKHTRLTLRTSVTLGSRHTITSLRSWWTTWSGNPILASRTYRSRQPPAAPWPWRAADGPEALFECPDLEQGEG